MAHYRRGSGLLRIPRDGLAEAPPPAGSSRLDSFLSCTTLSMGVPTEDQRAIAGADPSCYDLTIIPGKVRPFTSPAEHLPQVLIIARKPPAKASPHYCRLQREPLVL